MNRHMIWWLILVATLLSAGCFPQADSGEETPQAPLGTTGEPGEPAIEEPPQATLRINQQSQLSGVGNYCWRTTESETLVCVDTVGIPTAPDPIPAGSPVQARFEFAVSENPSLLQLLVIPVTDQDLMDEADLGLSWWEPRSGDQYALPLESPSEIELALEAGLYVLNVFAKWETFGDVSYGFLVEIVSAAEVPGFIVQDTDVTAIVTLPDQVTFYSGPGENYASVATVFGGLIWPVTGVSEDGSWWRLRCVDDAGEPVAECWVSADAAVTSPAESASGQFIVLFTEVEYVRSLPTVGLNIRGGPGLDQEVVGLLEGGQIAQVTGISEDEEWWRIICPDDTIGSCWVSADPSLSEPTQQPQ